MPLANTEALKTLDEAMQYLLSVGTLRISHAQSFDLTMTMNKLHKLRLILNEERKNDKA